MSAPAGTVERRPGRASLAVVAGALGAGVVALATAAAVAALVASGGGAVLLAGTVSARRVVVDAGFAVVVGALLVAGVAGGAVAPLLVAAVAGVVAWDAATHGVGLGEQLGRDARTTRAVAAHVGTTLSACSAVGAVAFLAYRLSAGGRPVVTLVALLAGAVLLVGALRR